MITKKKLELDANMNFKDLLFHIRLNGYGYVGFQYFGSGDSGSIDEIYLVPKEHAKQNAEGYIIGDYGYYDYETTCPHSLPQEIVDIISEKIYAYILNDASDWYNNDGGGGNGYICTENGDFSTDHYINIMSREEEIIKGNLFD